MQARKRGFILCSAVAAVLLGASLIYGLVWGVPQWSRLFQGALEPMIFAYDGWPLATGIVAAGLATLGACIGLSWRQGTFHYLILALGLLSVLVFVSMGLPAQLLTQITNTLSFVVVGLCGLFLLGIFFFAFKDRLSRRYRR